jgi:hypothetical protein
MYAKLNKQRSVPARRITSWYQLETAKRNNGRDQTQQIASVQNS